MVIDSELIKWKEAKTEFSVMESHKYLVVKNHVREIYESSESSNSSKEQCEESKDSLQKCKKRKKPEKQSSSEDPVTVNTKEISESDLSELRNVYKKCKSVLLKIESKYGHLLDFNKDECKSRKRKHDNNEQYECKCSIKNKVVFNDDGNTTQSVGSSLDHHICPNRLPTFNRYNPVQVETDKFNISLPDNIKELEEMLKNTSLPLMLRNKIFSRIKSIKHENLDMIRLHKQSFIEKLKSNPDDNEILDFKGTNFSCILGYPNKPI